MAVGDSLVLWSASAGQPPASNYAVLDVRNGHVVLDFDDTTNQSADLVGVVPDSYTESNSQTVVLTWAATSATSGAARWEVQIERQEPGASFDLDSDGFSSAQSGATTTPATAGQIVQTEISLSGLAASLLPHAGESFRLRVTRDATDVGDTLVGDAELLAAELREA